MIRHFGLELYDSVRRWPPALIYRALEIQREREAERRLLELHDTSLSTGLKLGQRYVDPSNRVRQGNEPYYTLEPLIKMQQQLERAARPWEFTPEAVKERREAEEDRDFDAMWSEVGRMHA